MSGARQFDEDALLDAVLAVFWRQGWQATTMADLAAAAGVQRGSLYHAYGGKEALFLLAFDRYAERFIAEARRALDAADAGQALQRFFQAAIRHMRAGEPARGCLTTKTAAELDAAGPAIQARLAALLETLRATLTQALAAPHLAAGLALPPGPAAELLVTFTRGLAVMERIEAKPARLRASARAMTWLLLKDPGAAPAA
ncbi:TetR/AcrR family transcriptional regulator [Comamonadaceae bacterium OH2545_COT-014]|nr:TetR/AcrR family transcriptional regulator [Comamonadaceae bacterium OH2545_COT-014]